MREAISTNSGGPPETSLVWLRHDLRLEDNPVFALPSVRRPYQLLVMYVLDQRWLTPVEGLPRLGPARLRLLWQSLMNLRGMLLRRGSDLLVRVGDPVSEVLAQVRQHDVNCLEVSHSRTPDDAGNLQRLAAQLPASTRLHCHPREGLVLEPLDERDAAQEPTALWTPPQVMESPAHGAKAMSLAAPELPASSRLSPALASRGAMSLRLDDAQWWTRHASRNPLQGLPCSLPPWPESASRGFPPLEAVCATASAWQPVGEIATLQGGEEPAREQLSSLVWSRPESEDAEVQAAWRLSAWLAQGCISPRRILQALAEHRREMGESLAAHQLMAVLLQREYWQRVLQAQPEESLMGWYGEALEKEAACDVAFQRWREGRTGDVRVDRAMHRLTREGWLPWDERQHLARAWLAAGGDWRLGARWFEHCLLDFDAAVHWGEWRHLAGQPV